MYALSFLLGVGQVKDSGMYPTLRPFDDNTHVSRQKTMLEKFQAFCLADKVLYSKLKVMPD